MIIWSNLDNSQSNFELRYSILLPNVNLEDFYFVSRHPKDFSANLKPFNSLSEDVWLFIASAYLMIILCSVIIYSIVQDQLPRFERSKSFLRVSLESFMDPSLLYWQKVVKSGSLFQSLVAFNMLVFNILYGVNLRSALVDQNFEYEVNSWADINFFDSYFIHNHDVISNISPDMLHHHILSMKSAIGMENNIIKYNLKRKSLLWEYHANKAQEVSSPSGLVLMMNEFRKIHLN